MLTWISVLEDKDGFGIKMPEKQCLVFTFSHSYLPFSVTLEGPPSRAGHAFLGPTRRVWNPKMGLGSGLFLSFKHPRSLQMAHGPPRETYSVS